MKSDSYLRTGYEFIRAPTCQYVLNYEIIFYVRYYDTSILSLDKHY